MARTITRQILTFAPGLVLLCFWLPVSAQVQTALPTEARGVIRLRVRVAPGDGAKAKGVARKRFFLLKGSLDENKNLIESSRQQPLVSRDCYYRSIGASDALIAWLKQHDCETVYCREVERQDVEGATAVPEFQHAVATGEKEFGSRDLARKWLTANLAENIKSGFYQRQQEELCTVLKALCPAHQGAPEQPTPKVMSVMTDANGTGYFTDLEKGAYVITNVVRTELGDVAELWSCEVQVKAGDLVTEKPLLVTNPKNKDPKDKNITGARRCVSVESPVPACPVK
jgi:hypothetical protein